MSETPETIQTGIETVLDTISGLKVLDNVPETARDLPAVLVFLSGVEQDEWETGGATDNLWKYAVYILVKSDRGKGRAMIAHAAWIAKVLTALRGDTTLDGSCDFSLITDGGDPEPVTEGTFAYVVKTLYVTARTTES